MGDIVVYGEEYDQVGIIKETRRLKNNQS